MDDSHQRRLESKRRYRERHKDRLNRERREYRQAHRDRAVAATKKWEQGNPEKVRAHQHANNATRRGHIEPQPCEVCGAERAEKHHDDYSKPLEIRWLCRQHHVDHHARMAS